MIFNMMCGGGGAGIDLTVVGGTTQPTSPEKNTIWVNTSTTIGNIYLQATEPTSPAEGDIWVMTGTKFASAVQSVVSAQVCDSPCLVISMVAVQQYVSGAWVLQTDSFYDGTAWHDSVALMLSNGTVGAYTMTYGTIRVNSSAAAYTVTTSSPAPTITAYGSKSCVELTHTYSSSRHNYGALVVWNVDLTEYTKLVFDAQTSCDTNGDSDYSRVIATVMDTSAAVYFSNVSSGVKQQYSADSTAWNKNEMDVSDLTGVYNIVVYGYYRNLSSSSKSNYISELYLERG